MIPTIFIKARHKTVKPPPIPEKRLKLYTMELHYSQDVEQLEKIVQSRVDHGKDL